jgi:hypothetical protein
MFPRTSYSALVTVTKWLLSMNDAYRPTIVDLEIVLTFVLF